MSKLLRSAFALASLSTICSAQTLTETFGSGANAFTMDFVTIGNPNNAADTTGTPNPAGSVSYVYNIGKYEISRGIIEKANNSAGLGISMWDMAEWGFGSNGPNQPATGLNWFHFVKFVNYLNTSSGYQAAYKFDNNSNNFQLWTINEAGYNAANPFRNSLAKYFIPNSDEWYKAAFGSPNGTWYKYATGSNIAPTGVVSGTSSDTAVYNQWIHSGPASVDSAGGLSAFGTMAQTGNVWEMTESPTEGYSNDLASPRELRGGQWTQPNDAVLSSSFKGTILAYDGGPDVGFRVAMVPEPSALSLLAIGLGGLAMMRRRRS
jgi:formylglycine-generating enzyme required for sulfatase activity